MKLLSIHLRKLFILAVLAGVFSIGSATSYACMDYIGNSEDGSPVFISCGSSTGNYLINYDAEGVFIMTGPDIDQYCNSCGSCYTACLGGVAGVIAANCRLPRPQERVPFASWKSKRHGPNQGIVY